MPTFTAEPFTAEFVDELVALSVDRPPIPGLSGDVGLGVGSKVDASKVTVVLAIVDGRAVGMTDRTPEIVVGLSKKQVPEWLAGDLVLARAYMQGDLKPVGASGPLFAALEFLDWVTGAGS